MRHHHHHHHHQTYKTVSEEDVRISQACFVDDDCSQTMIQRKRKRENNNVTIITILG